MNRNVILLYVCVLVLEAGLFFSWYKRKKVERLNVDLKCQYDSLQQELKRSFHERDNFNIRFDSLNLRYKDLVSLDSVKTLELKAIKGKYKSKTSQELQKLMIDGAKE